VSGFCQAQRLEWVVFGRIICDEERLHDDPQRPFTPRRPLFIMQRPLESARRESLTGQFLQFPMKRKTCRNQSYETQGNWQGAAARSICYWITSSARTSNSCGNARPSACAVLRLIMSSNLVGICTGRSDGLAPFKMRST